MEIDEAGMGEGERAMGEREREREREGFVELGSFLRIETMSLGCNSVTPLELCSFLWILILPLISFLFIFFFNFIFGYNIFFTYIYVIIT